MKSSEKKQKHELDKKKNTFKCPKTLLKISENRKNNVVISNRLLYYLQFKFKAFFKLQLLFDRNELQSDLY